MMPDLHHRIDHHLEVLVDHIGARPPGSPANRRATSHASQVLRDAGLHVREDPFTTRWWEPGRARLTVAATTAGRAVHSRTEVDGRGSAATDGDTEVEGATIELLPNPYSPAGVARGSALVARRVEDLEGLQPDGDRVLVLTDALARTQLLPAVFPFLDLPEHADVRAQLHRLTPAAVIAVSDHWEPILEDPDLPFPSLTLSTAEGERLRSGDLLHLEVTGAVHEGRGVNLAARSGAGRRLVLCAHLDAKATTPGAFDNAGSVAVLLALAELGHLDDLPVEVVLFNGEDHVDACGEVAWLGATELAEVAGVVNVDGTGLRGLGTSLASLACPRELETRLTDWVGARDGWVRTDPWIESDHAIFALQGIPAVAITSEDVHALLGGLAHTAADTREVIDLQVLVGIGHDLPDLLGLLAGELI